MGSAASNLPLEKVGLCQPGQTSAGDGWREGRTEVCLNKEKAGEKWTEGGSEVDQSWEGGGTGMGDLGRILAPNPGLTSITWVTQIAQAKSRMQI